MPFYLDLYFTIEFFIFYLQFLYPIIEWDCWLYYKQRLTIFLYDTIVHNKFKMYFHPNYKKNGVTACVGRNYLVWKRFLGTLVAKCRLVIYFKPNKKLIKNRKNGSLASLLLLARQEWCLSRFSVCKYLVCSCVQSIRTGRKYGAKCAIYLR